MEYNQIMLRHDTQANWNRYNPVLQEGEMAIVFMPDGTSKIKIGDGHTAYLLLPFNGMTQEEIDKLLVDYAKKNDIPTAVSQLTNDSGYVTMAEVENKDYATNTRVDQIENKIPTDVVNEQEVNTIIDEKNYVPKGDFATVNGQSITAGGNVQIEIPADVVTNADLENKNYQNADQVNAIVDGKGYATMDQIPTDNATLANGAGYVTDNEVTEKGYQTADQVTSIVNSKGFLSVAEMVDVADDNVVLDVETNKVYNCTAIALSTLTINSIQNSPIESAIYFNSGETPTSITITPSMKIIGDIATIEKNKQYVISIKNNYLAIAHDGITTIDWADIVNTPIFPTATSELTNDSGFVESRQLNTINGERIDQGQNIEINSSLETVDINVTSYNEQDFNIEVEPNKIYRFVSDIPVTYLHSMHLVDKTKQFSGVSYVIWDSQVQYWDIQSNDFVVNGNKQDYFGNEQHIITIAGDYRTGQFANIDLLKRSNSNINNIPIGMNTDIAGVENLPLYISETNSVDSPDYLSNTGTFLYDMYDPSLKDFDEVYLQCNVSSNFSIITWSDESIKTKKLIIRDDVQKEFKTKGKLLYDETGNIKRIHIAFVFPIKQEVVFTDEIYELDCSSFTKKPSTVEVAESEVLIDIFENTNYKCTAPELTSLKINLASDFPMESNIYFRSGATPTTITLLPSFTVIGNVANLVSNTNYCITIKNMVLEIKKAGVPVVDWANVVNAPTIPINVGDLNNDAGYQTADQVTASVNTVKTEIEAKIPQTTEVWKFTLDDGSVVEKTIYVK